jgi:hypothetical protein
VIQPVDSEEAKIQLAERMAAELLKVRFVPPCVCVCVCVCVCMCVCVSFYMLFVDLKYV